MRFPLPPIVDPMGETFSREDFESLAYNIDREMRTRPLQSQPLLVAELGTWSGQSTLAIARPHVLVHCISDWEMPAEFKEGDGIERSERQWLSLRQSEDGCPRSVAFQTFVRNTKGIVFRNAMPLRCDPDFVCEWWPEKLDAVFINCDTDGKHLHWIVNAWRRHVRPGGNIFGRYKDHTVDGLTGLGGYNVDGTIWRYRVMKEYCDEVGA